ncbi:hypothetical protein M422DRAFT_239041 [Sphaerobolus stellatus SS14]|nr:hypothetical protein M422DRAFT_239041 [Sphaerobolus stellatus SS14]
MATRTATDMETVLRLGQPRLPAGIATHLAELPRSGPRFPRVRGDVSVATAHISDDDPRENGSSYHGPHLSDELTPESSSEDEAFSRDERDSLRSQPPINSELPRGTQNAASNINTNKKLRGGITIASQNMRGGRSHASRLKWNQINQLMRERNISILVLQETHVDDSMIDDISKLFDRQLHILNSHDPTNLASKGVAFVINKRHVKWQELISTEIIPGRASLLSVPWRG